jgi:hypothetical protein
MRTAFPWALPLLLAACGAPSFDPAPDAGSVGGAGGTGSTGSAGGGASGPTGGLCDEVTVTSSSCTPNNYHDPLVSFVASSGFVFRGTVTAVQATTPGIDPADKSRMVVAHVDAVLFEAGMLGIEGQSVTIQLLAAPTMAVGYEGYFFASLWTLGQSIGMTEVVHIDPGVYPTIESDVPGIVKLLADERLYARMQTAGTVLVGTVTAITPLPSMGPVSEHDPLWAAATITAECALRGATPSGADVAFATSDDVAWVQSPKLSVGEKGVFLLQPVPSPPGIWSIPAEIPYLVTDRLDVQPPEERAHVATLVLCPPGH